MSLPPIDDAELRRLRQVDADNTALRSRVDAVERSNATLKSQVQERDSRIAQLAAETGDTEAFRKEIAELSNQNRTLQLRIDQLTKEVPRVAIKDLVENFRSSVAQINKEVLTRPAKDQTPVVVEAMDVEIKGGIDISNGLHLAQLPADQLVAGSVSTVRFTLRPASTIKMVED